MLGVKLWYTDLFIRKFLTRKDSHCSSPFYSYLQLYITKTIFICVFLNLSNDGSFSISQMLFHYPPQKQDPPFPQFLRNILILIKNICYIQNSFIFLFRIPSYCLVFKGNFWKFHYSTLFLKFAHNAFNYRVQ